MMIANQNFAQTECNYSTCTTVTKEINSAITINSATTWETGTAPNDYTCTIINAKVTINSSLTINAVDLKMTTNGWFQINNGGTLTITSGTEIYAYSNMWGSTAGGSGPDGGIKVKGGGTLNVDGAIIAEAYLAINDVSNATDGEANIYLDGTCFFNNQVAIVVGPYTGTMDSHIIACRFAAPSLIAPLSGIGDFGIYLNQVRPTDPFLIGDDLQYQAVSAHNEFEQLDVAIESYRSDTKIVDNLFHDLNTGVHATGTTSVNVSLSVGRPLVIPPDIDHELLNLFTNVKEAIVVSNHVNTYIYHNWIESDYDAGTGEYIMDRAIDISNTCPEIIIDINFIHNFNNRGIYIHNNPGATNVYIHFNSLVEYSPLDNIVSTGIVVAETTAGSSINLNIDGNQIVNVLTGIRLINIDDATVYFNSPTYQYLDGGGVAYGMRLYDCDNAIISNNVCTGNYETGLGFEDNVRGIYLEECHNFEVTGNSITTSSEGIYVYKTSTEGVFKCNMMDGCNYGIYLLGIGGSAITSPIHSDLPEDPPSDNHWFPEDAANRVTTEDAVLVTNCVYTNWNYWDDPEQYNIPSGLTNQFSFSTLPNFILTERDGDPCAAYGEEAMFFFEYEALVEELENIFGTWAIAFNQEEVVDLTGSWFRQYLFWNKILRYNIDEKDLSEELQDLHESVSTSNIPLFITLTDSISQSNISDSKDILNTITPVNDIEYYWHLTSQIYLNNIDSIGEFILNEEDEVILRSIADMSAELNGPGVYQAWMMLDTIVEHYRQETEERLSPDIHENITLVPNPAQLYLTISYNDVDYLKNNLESIEVYNLTGERVKIYLEIKSSTLFVGDLSKGMYLFKINFEDNTNSISKIIINE